MKKLSEKTDRFGIPIEGWKHSPEFLKILQEDDPANAISAITHTSPLLVFWVKPDGTVIDAGKAHRSLAPDGDASIFADPKHKGHLRGRSAFFGATVYIVIYGKELSRNQMSLLRRSYPSILEAISKKNPEIPKTTVGTAIFVGEDGEALEV
jgi:hypothetical protein